MSTVTPLRPLAQRPLSQRVAATVRAEMARLGVSQHDLANALGVTQQAVSLKIKGSRPMTIDELDIVAPLLGMTVVELLADAKSPRSGGPLRPRSDSNGQPTGGMFAQVINLDDRRRAAAHPQSTTPPAQVAHHR